MKSLESVNDDCIIVNQSKFFIMSATQRQQRSNSTDSSSQSMSRDDRRDRGRDETRAERGGCSSGLLLSYGSKSPRRDTRENIYRSKSPIQYRRSERREATSSMAGREDGDSPSRRWTLNKSTKQRKPVSGREGPRDHRHARRDHSRIMKNSMDNNNKRERSCFHDGGGTGDRLSPATGRGRRSYFHISHRDDPRKVAGKIAWNVRRTDDDSMKDVDMDPILASGSASIATALGVIATAREYVGSDQDPVELLFSIDFLHDDCGDDSDDDDEEERKNKNKKRRIDFDGVVDVVMRLKRCPRRYEDGTENVVVASSRSKVVPLAGAIAGRLRENKGDGVMIEAIGDDAVAVMAMALAQARMFLHEDGIDFLVGVRLKEIRKTGGDGVRRSLISFSCRCHVID